MLGTDSSKKMNNRGGLPVKNIVTAIFILLSIYLVYIYNVAQNRLHDAEMTQQRYRRETEDKATEIQGLIAAKDEFQERSESEKRELNNRLKSINQKHSMLQSQYSEIEADFQKLKQDMENLRAEHTQTESQHAQEYQQLKQAKDKEIAEGIEELAKYKKENEDLQNSIATLQAQVQSHEMELQKALQMVETLQNAKKNLLDQNAQLQMLQFQQQKQLELQKQNEDNAQKAKVLQEEQKQINVVSEQQLGGGGGGDAGVNGNQQQQNILSENNNNNNNNQDGQNVNVMSQDNNNNNPGNSPNAHNDDLNEQAVKIDELNALNQAAKPPNFNGNPTLDEDDTNGVQKPDEHRPEVNPNDLQKGQILEPLKDDGGEADGLGKMNLREVEEKREREEMENQAVEHNKNPLDLGQMQHPLDNNGDQLARDDMNINGEDNKVGQQPPPVFGDHKQNVEAGLDADQGQYYQNREDNNGDAPVEDDDPLGADDDDNVNDKFDEDEEEALDINNNDRAKAVDEQLNAWRHFNMGPQPAFGGENNNIPREINDNNNLNNIQTNNENDIDVGDKYDDNDDNKENQEDEDELEEEEDDDNNADDDYGANIGGAADGPDDRNAAV